MNRSTWDPHSVQEWDFISRQSRETRQTVHVARIFEICVVKGAELADNDPARNTRDAPSLMAHGSRMRTTSLPFLMKWDPLPQICKQEKL